MGKKVLSVVLIVVLAFLSGFGGGMLALQQTGNKVTTINAFGQKIEIGQKDNGGSAGSNTAGGQSGNVTISVSEDATIAEAIAEKVMPSVVGISTTYSESYSSYSGLSGLDIFGWGFGNMSPYQSYDATSVGTGVIVDAAGYILTNSHVVNDGDYKSINVSLYDGREAEGTVLWNDATLDLAVVKIDETNLTAAELGDSDTVRVGAYAAAIGNPLGLAFERSMSQGIISGLNRTISVSSGSSSTATTMENLIQTDATINSGNSGGPLLNSKGLVIGINSAKASSGEGMGFAIPINVAKPIVEQIKETGAFNRPYLGISGTGLESQSQYYTDEQFMEEFGTTSGIYVASVTAGGGAEAAGLQKGDVITKVDGKEVGTMNKINTILVSHRIGDTIEVEYMRDKEAHTVQVTLTGDTSTLIKKDQSGSGSNSQSGSGSQGNGGQSGSGNQGGSDNQKSPLNRFEK